VWSDSNQKLCEIVEGGSASASAHCHSCGFQSRYCSGSGPVRVLLCSLDQTRNDIGEGADMLQLQNKGYRYSNNSKQAETV
jgi:hypothetical protein